LTEQDSLQQLIDLKIHPLKGNPNRTHREQANDLMMGFKGLKSKQQSTTASQSHPSSDLKNRILDMLNVGAARDVLHLQPQRASALADFVACLPSIAASAFSAKHNQKGYTSRQRSA
jgi:cytochrome c-type biogenesis protein CcmH/NrfF